MTSREDPSRLLEQTYGPGGEIRRADVPGRVNLIGEHIDYHGLAVLPMALDRRVRVAFRARDDRRIRAVSGDGYGAREFEWTAGLKPVPAGDWENYLRAAAEVVSGKWGFGYGIDAAVVSDLPAAAGLSSSSAVLVAFTLGLLWANGRRATFEELMEVLPDGEQFVGTRGGGMDHAAVLGSREGYASLIEFVPLSLQLVPVPQDWAFLVAHSMVTAEKSGSAREQYNSRRVAGSTALVRLGFPSYQEAIRGRAPEALAEIASRLATPEEQDSFLHTTSEALRVKAAVSAMEQNDAATFGRLLVSSHESLRDRLKISCDALDRLVERAMASGALGARLTGGGFGGCAVVFCLRRDVEQVRAGIISRFYSHRSDFVEHEHLVDAPPSAGALQTLEW